MRSDALLLNLENIVIIEVGIVKYEMYRNPINVICSVISSAVLSISLSSTWEFGTTAFINEYTYNFIDLCA